MNLLNFIGQYPDGISSKQLEIKTGVFAIIVAVLITIGKATSGSMIVRTVKAEQNFVAERLCMVPSYRFAIGLWPCTFLLLQRKVFLPLNFRCNWHINIMN